MIDNCTTAGHESEKSFYRFKLLCIETELFYPSIIYCLILLRIAGGAGT